MMSDPTVSRQTVSIEHVRIESAKAFEAVKTALENIIPQLEPKALELVAQGESARALRLLEQGPELAIFLCRDHGTLLQIAGAAKKALQYEIGNPLTASKMTRHRLPAALYAPLRVVLYENEQGHAVFEYDCPSTLFGQFGDDEVTKVALGLDEALEGALRRAAG